MSESKEARKGRGSRSLVLVLLAWIFIGGQGLLAAGNLYNYANSNGDPKAKAETGKMPWELAGQGAQRMLLIARQAKPDVVGDVAIFLAVLNALGLAALLCGLLSWSRSRYRSGKLTIAVAIAIIVANSIVNLPYA